MKPFLFAGLLLFALSEAFGQDIIVLRNDQSELKCRIVTVTDSTVHYLTWRTQDTSVHVMPRKEVLSIITDHNSQKAGLDLTAGMGSNELSSTYLEGQDPSGYVVLLTGDTLYGNISVKNMVLNQLQVAFTDPHGSKRDFMPAELRGYGYARLTYKTVKTSYKGMVYRDQPAHEGMLFLEVLVDGPSSLYHMYTITFSKTVWKNYGGNPPYYTGNLKGFLFLSNPAGNLETSKNGTVRGMMNRSYYTYTGFSLPPSVRVSVANMPEVVRTFNDWYLTAGAVKK